jgi:beta-N-acetylhexosaminidase
MALAAARDTELAYLAGKISATEGRSLGVHVNFYPIVDVNNNPRNPIINIRSFGEDVGLVSQMAAAYIRGIHDAGMLSTAKHFPGHGDTAVDTHLGLALIEHPRSRLDAVELPPFRQAVADGVDAVMSSHIALPALDAAPGIPATLSRPILTGVLRGEMGFDGLIFTDSMSMYAISRNFPADKAAAMAVEAGADCVLHSPDDDAAFRGIKEAVAAGAITEEHITKSAERILRAKARLGLHKSAITNLEALPLSLGTREHAQQARMLADRALTLIKDDKQQVPLTVPREARVLYLSVIDYPSGWREGAPSRGFTPELRKRWPNTTAVEISDRTPASELDLVRVLARQADAVVASVFVRIASFSGRMDLSPAQIDLLRTLSRQERPFVTVLFGNPYAATFLPELPAVLLTYETFDGAEAAAVRALAGEIPIGGKLPITLPEMFPFGHGLERAVR